jgi:hypothetical protein
MDAWTDDEIWVKLVSEYESKPGVVYNVTAEFYD